MMTSDDRGEVISDRFYIICDIFSGHNSYFEVRQLYLPVGLFSCQSLNFTYLQPFLASIAKISSISQFTLYLIHFQPHVIFYQLLRQFSPNIDLFLSLQIFRRNCYHVSTTCNSFLPGLHYFLPLTIFCLACYLCCHLQYFPASCHTFLPLSIFRLT